MCLVRSGREGGRNCREDLLAGGQPPIRPNGGEKRAASFPRPVTKRLRVRSMLMRLLKLAAHTRTRRCTACNLPRWNTIETIPVILAFPTCLQPCVPCIQQNGKRANGFEREKDRERERFVGEAIARVRGRGRVFLPRDTRNTVSQIIRGP